MPINQLSTKPAKAQPLRLTIELLVELLAEGTSLEELQKQYPRLTREMVLRALKSYFALPHISRLERPMAYKEIKR